MATKPTTRSKSSVFLIGNPDDAIQGTRLPTNKQVMKVFFHFHSELKFSVRESSSKTVDLVIPFWEKGGIPIKAKQHVIAKIESMFMEWKNLQRSKSRRSGVQIQKEEAFISSLNSLFDIAHQDAMQMIKIQEDKDFLIFQRQGLQGSMVGVDVTQWKKDVKNNKKQKRIRIG